MTDFFSAIPFLLLHLRKYIVMKRIYLVSVIVSAVICLSGCINEETEVLELETGDGLPDFRVEMSDGSIVSDESLKGRVSCVVFFHTTCPDCQKTLPVIQDIYEAYADKGVGFTLISREQPKDEIDAFWNEKGLNMPYSAQTDRKIYSKFAQSRIPRVYICDKDGIIRYIFTDDPIPSYEDLKSSLYELTGLDVEEEVHYVSILNDVLLSLDSELSCSSACRL